jgi:hypothetical protein
MTEQKRRTDLYLFESGKLVKKIENIKIIPRETELIIVNDGGQPQEYLVLGVRHVLEDKLSTQEEPEIDVIQLNVSKES